MEDNKYNQIIESIIDTIVNETFIRGIELEVYREKFRDAAVKIYSDLTGQQP